VCLKSVRDHYNHLEKKQKRKSGRRKKLLELPHSTQPLMIPLQILLRDSRPEDQRQVAAHKEKADADAAVTTDTRKASMETFFENQKMEGQTRCEKQEEGYRVRYSSFFESKGGAGCCVEETGAKNQGGGKSFCNCPTALSL